MGKLTATTPYPQAPVYPEPDFSGPSSSAPLLLDFSDPPPKPSDDDLPAYDDPSYLGEEPPPFTKYSPTKHLLTNGKVVSHDTHLNTDPEALFQWIHDEATSPPRPLLHIKGTHRSTRSNGKSSSTVTDFDLYFDLSSFLPPTCQVLAVSPAEKRRRGSRNMHTAHEEDARNIRDWCADYIHASAPWKEFLLRKRVGGVDQDLLRIHVESMVRSTNYRGHIRVAFPVENRSVVLAPDNWVCRVRYGHWRWLFYLSFLWLLTWPMLWLGTRRWDVVDALFEARPGAEKAWVDRWGWVIMRLVKQRRESSHGGAFTPENLRWVETHELAVEAEREQRRREARSGAGVVVWVGGFLRGLGELGDVGCSWGADE